MVGHVIAIPDQAASYQAAADIAVEGVGKVRIVELRRPPENHLDLDLAIRLADTLVALDNEKSCRTIVLASAGKCFCAGAHFAPIGSGAAMGTGAERITSSVYVETLRILDCRKPIVAAVQGPAIGAGLGLALLADFRVTCPEARFSANFTRLGIHPGFGMTVTLPRLVGVTAADLLFMTGRRIDGATAVRIGLADELVELGQVRFAAIALASEIAECSPAAVQATRETTRLGLALKVRDALGIETAKQRELAAGPDFEEGIRASAERRLPDFGDC